MTERELSRARSLQAEPDALRGVAAIEPGREVPDAIGRQTRAVESAGIEVMAFIAEIPDPRIRAIAAMGFPECGSRETMARRMHCERTSPAKQLRRFPRGRMWARPAVGASFL